jgi:peptidyl-prolyl cis-trans isomerase B (cyclophilin B)
LRTDDTTKEPANVSFEKSLRTVGILLVILLLLAPVFALQACGPTDDAGTEPASEEAEDAASDDVTESVPGEENQVEYHVSDVEVKGDEIAVIETNKGTIEFEFYPEEAPNTVATFIELADEGYYDGIKFHRVEPGFVIQGGDPLSRENDPMVGTGGPGWYLREEFNDLPHLDGSVAMARSNDPDSAGSQFYITMGPQPFLDGKYTVFGQVVEGLDVVYEIQVGDVMERVYVKRSE